MAEKYTSFQHFLQKNRNNLIAGITSFGLIIVLTKGGFSANYTSSVLVLEVSTIIFTLFLFMVSLFKFSENKTSGNYYLWFVFNCFFWAMVSRNVLLPAVSAKYESAKLALLGLGNGFDIAIFLCALLVALFFHHRSDEPQDQKPIVGHCLGTIVLVSIIHSVIILILPKVFKLDSSFQSFGKAALPFLLLVQLLALAVIVLASAKYITKRKEPVMIMIAVSGFCMLLATLPLSKITNGGSANLEFVLMSKMACFIIFLFYLTSEYREVIQTTAKETGVIEDKVSEKIQQIARQSEAIREKTIESREATRIKSELLANMSHELRTPMNSIIGFTSRVIKKTQDLIPEQQTKNLKTVERNAYQLLSLINTILDVSKIEAGRMEIFCEEIHLKELVTDVIEMGKSLIGRKEVNLVADAEGEETITSDRTKIKQMLINLMGNAIKFTEQGEIRIQVKHSDNIFEGRKQVVVPGVSISVKDTGIGIKGEELPYIFDDYKQVDGSLTRKTGGTGLGLALVKRFSQLLGGHVEVESEYERGTAFTIYLPKSSEAFVQQEEATTSKTQVSSRKVVLLYDVAEENVAIQKAYLDKNDFEATITTSVDESFVFAKENYPRLVVLDVLTVDKKGVDVLRKFRDNYYTKDVRFCFSKLYNGNKYGYFFNVVDFVYKPVNKELVSTIVNIAARACERLKSILVVDHDEGSLNLLHPLLLQEGDYAVRIARDLKETKAMLTKKIPDIILFNMFMPEGEGFKVIAEIGTHKKWCDVPVICLVSKMVEATHLKQSLENIAFLPDKSDLKQEDVVARLAKLANSVVL